MQVAVCAGAYDGSICGLDLAADSSKELNMRFGYVAHEGPVRDMVMRGSLMMSAGADDTVRIYDVKSQLEVGSLTQHDGPTNCVDLYGQRYALSGGDDGNLCVWRCRDWEVLRELKAHKGGVLDAEFHPEGVAAISIGADRRFKLWDLIRAYQAFQTKLSEVATQVGWIEDGRSFAIAYGSTVSVYSAEQEGSIIRSFQLPHRVLSMQPVDTHRIAIGGEKGFLQIGDMRDNGALASVADAHSTRVKSLTFVRNILFSADTNGTIKGWSLDQTVMPLCEVTLRRRLMTVCAGLVETDDSGTRSKRAPKARRVRDEKTTHAATEDPTEEDLTTEDQGEPPAREVRRKKDRKVGERSIKVATKTTTKTKQAEGTVQEETRKKKKRKSREDNEG